MFPFKLFKDIRESFKKNKFSINNESPSELFANKLFNVKLFLELLILNVRKSKL